MVFPPLRSLRLFVVECHCGSETLFHSTRSSGLCGHLAADRQKAPHSEMYGASGIPELIPPSSGPPRQPDPAGQYNPGHPQVNGHGAGDNPQRLGQRAPKLGQIGRTKKGERNGTCQRACSFRPPIKCCITVLISFTATLLTAT